MRVTWDSDAWVGKALLGKGPLRKALKEVEKEPAGLLEEIPSRRDSGHRSPQVGTAGGTGGLQGGWPGGRAREGSPAVCRASRSLCPRPGARPGASCGTYLPAGWLRPRCRSRALGMRAKPGPVGAAARFTGR